jgi:hypothetical protein
MEELIIIIAYSIWAGEYAVFFNPTFFFGNPEPDTS